MEKLDPKKINRLIVAVSHNDQDALTELFQYTKANMENHSAFYAFSQSDVSDIMSELYLNVYRYSRSFDPTKNGYNWMLQIVKHLAYQSNKSRSEIAYSLDDPDFENNADLSEKSDVLQNLIVSEGLEILSEVEKRYIYQKYWEGYTITEIAKRERIPVSTVYSKLKRAYEKLKKFYLHA